eukprot:CAMPEP_0176458472 /NCGR_PEP_ID=MMETSP0127-20121128/32630_1 /TAXON_ID=938130 /ORGANISM="Platyophrya macrostoma, Strain WH" /LENGTH=176 /DNA_ID=CAMNT_0017849081 /DNA_START=78 /DNA_END=608 /DNA_ORIENTATION=-
MAKAEITLPTSQMATLTFQQPFIQQIPMATALGGFDLGVFTTNTLISQNIIQPILPSLNPSLAYPLRTEMEESNNEILDKNKLHLNPRLLSLSKKIQKIEPKAYSSQELMSMINSNNSKSLANEPPKKIPGKGFVKSSSATRSFQKCNSLYSPNKSELSQNSVSREEGAKNADKKI